MLRTKFVARLYNAQGQMLGWQEFLAFAPGDGSLCIEEPVSIPYDLGGTAVEISYHWCDVNIETRVPLSKADQKLIKAGASIILSPAPIVFVGATPKKLDPVSPRGNVTISVPAGNMAAIGNR